MALLDDEILERFNYLLREAQHSELSTFTLASVDERGLPTQRTVTLLHIDKRGLVFFTSSQSRKGRHFARQPYASACFYWHSLRQQVEFDGKIEVVDDKQTDEYWDSRERDSQICAWASQQSERLESREQLLNQIDEIKDRYRDIKIPRPPHWVAYRLSPERVEFWKAGWHRVHERTCFKPLGNSWEQILLYP